jgi:hypothetical protein
MWRIGLASVAVVVVVRLDNAAPLASRVVVRLEIVVKIATTVVVVVEFAIWLLWRSAQQTITVRFTRG